MNAPSPPRSASKAQWPRASSQHRRPVGLETLCAHFSKDLFWGCPVADSQPFPQGSRRSQAVAGRHRSSRREQCPRESPPRSPPCGSEQDQITTSPGVGVVQDVPLTCSEARFPSPGCDRQGHRAEGRLRIGGGRGTTQTRGSPGSSSAGATCY